VTVQSDEYNRVLNSVEWKIRRHRMIAAAGGCERCYLITRKLELHHKHYDSLGNESDDDIEVLCAACHREADREREQLTELNHRYAQVDGWARKVHGGSWQRWKSYGEAEDEFDEWLER